MADGQQDKSRPLFALNVNVPEKTAKNMEEMAAQLMTTRWAKLKAFTNASLEAGIARMELASARSKEAIRKLTPESEALQTRLTHLAEEQELVDRVAARTLQILAERYKDSPRPDAEKDIAKSWLRRFRKEVEGLGDEDLKEVFSRILANEIEQPGSFSISTLRALGTIDQHVAELYSRAASIALIYRTPTEAIEARLYAPISDLGNNGLAPYGLEYSNLTLLMENGLLRADYNSWRQFPLYQHPVHISCQGRRWSLSQAPGTRMTESTKLYGAAFTTVGVELLSIVDVQQYPNFLSALRASLANKSIEMEEIT